MPIYSAENPQSSTLSTTESDKIETEVSDRERIDALEKQVHELQLSLDELRQKYEHLSFQNTCETNPFLPTFIHYKNPIRNRSVSDKNGAVKTM